MMADALDTAIGKPGTDLKIVYIGTIAPSNSGWWPSVSRGRFEREHVRTVVAGRPKALGFNGRRLRRVNPLTSR